LAGFLLHSTLFCDILRMSSAILTRSLHKEKRTMHSVNEQLALRARMKSRMTTEPAEVNPSRIRCGWCGLDIPFQAAKLWDGEWVCADARYCVFPPEPPKLAAEAAQEQAA
jgi:hypothetical protein